MAVGSPVVASPVICGPWGGPQPPGFAPYAVYSTVCLPSEGGEFHALCTVGQPIPGGTRLLTEADSNLQMSGTLPPPWVFYPYRAFAEPDRTAPARALEKALRTGSLRVRVSERYVWEGFLGLCAPPRSFEFQEVVGRDGEGMEDAGALVRWPDAGPWPEPVPGTPPMARISSRMGWVIIVRCPSLPAPVEVRVGLFGLLNREGER